MTSPGGILDFFILEASEYVEQLDALLARAGSSGPDADAVYRTSRALRGSATMAKQPSIADLAAALERVGRALGERALAWEPALGGAVVAAIDDLKLLVRAVRNWSPTEDQRAATRSAELTRYAPVRAGMTSTPTASSGVNFFASEAANIAAGLELLTARPNDRDGAGNVLRRVRALRGIAGIREIGPVSEVVEAAELVLKPLELGEGPITPAGLDVLRSGAELLRAVAASLRSGAAPEAPAPVSERFAAALNAFQGTEQPAERIVPISALFYDDAGPTVVSSAANPPTTPTERFRLEMVSQGEHLQGLVASARSSADPIARDRIRRELRHALESLRSAAQSFGEPEVAELIAGHEDAVDSLDYLALNSLDALASVLARPGAQGERLAARLTELKQGRALDAGIGSALMGTEPGATEHSTEPRLSAVIRSVSRQEAAALAARDAAAAAAPAAAPPPPPRPSAPTPSSAPTPIVNPAVPAPRPVRPSIATPVASSRAVDPRAPTPPSPQAEAPSAPPAAHRRSGEGLLQAIDASITGIGGLAERPLSPPRPLDLPVVPIDTLVYRGRAAIERAIEIRDQARRSGGTPEPAALDELFDLLDLALAE